MVFTRALPIPQITHPVDLPMTDIHPQNLTLTVRLGFYKVGTLKYISHLDLQRMMKRAFLRSGLPVWFSEGFNPHPKMVFATPLSVGAESICEFADIRMTAPVTPNEVIGRLNACLPDELQLFYAAPPVHKVQEVGWAAYEIRFFAPYLTAETAQALNALYTSSLTVVKKTKSGEKEVDIAPYIRHAHAEYLPEDGSILLHTTLCADSENFLNPEYLIKGAENAGILSFADPMTTYDTILRTFVTLSDGVTQFC